MRRYLLKTWGVWTSLKPSWWSVQKPPLVSVVHDQCLFPQGTTEWELDSLEPIIAVPKSDGTVHLCGVYTVTVNQDLEIAQYPLPVPEDLMSSLTRGKAFM